MSRKRVILSAAQKHEICETKENNPNISNVSLAQEYRIGKSTITDILKEKERWLGISKNQESVKKFCGPMWLQLENALNTKQDIDGNILKQRHTTLPTSFQ